MLNSVMQVTKGSVIGARNAAQEQFIRDTYAETPTASISNNCLNLIDNTFIDRGGEDDDDD